MAEAAVPSGPAAASTNTPDVLCRGPRILYAIVLTPGEKFGSSEDQLCMIAQALKAAGGECAALFSTPRSNPSMEDFTSQGIPSVFGDFSRFSVANLGRLVKLIDDNRIDAVHWNMFSPLRNPYLWALKVRRPGVKHLYTDHISRFVTSVEGGSFSDAREERALLGQGLAPKFWSIYAGVHCVSDFVRSELVGRTGIRHALTMLHFVNTPRFARNDVMRARTREEMGLGDSLTLLFMGQLMNEKGGHIAIRALSRLEGDVALLIAGSGPEEAKWRQLAADLGVADRVRFLGLVRNPGQYFNVADVLVSPSTWMEAAGFVNLEAQSAGLPVVGSRIGGIPEYVIEGETGLLFEPGNADALAGQLQRLVDDPGLRARLARQALEHARRVFSPERGTRDMIEWYRHSIGLSSVQPASVPQRRAAVL